MSEIESRITALEADLTILSALVRGAQLGAVAAKGESDAAAPLLEQRLQRIESAVGLLKLSKSVSL